MMLENIRSLHLALGLFILSFVYLNLQTENSLHQYLDQNQAWGTFSLILAGIIYYGLLQLRGP